MAISPQQEIAERIRDWQKGRPRGPYTLELYPTLRCNLSCAFCDTTYRKAKAPDELSREKYLSIADEAAELEVRRCYILGGGEPMVARDITPALMGRLKSHGIYGILGTNGTLFLEPFIRKVVAIGWDEIHFSLDGATPEVNDVLRGQKGVFSRVTGVAARLRAIKTEKEATLPRVLLHTVVTQLNYTQLEAMVNLAHELGCFRVNFDVLIPYRPEQEKLALGPEARSEIHRHAEKGLERAAALGIETTLDQFLHEETLDRGRMKFPSSPSRDVFGAPCLNPWHHIVVHHNGRVSPCCVIPPEDNSDSLHELSLKDVWFEGKTFDELRRSFVRKEMTRHCPNCSMAIISQNDAIRNFFNEFM